MVLHIDITDAPDAFQHLRITHVTDQRIGAIGRYCRKTAGAKDVCRLPDQSGLRVVRVEIEELSQLKKSRKG
jgi:hypothetical protein